ncbi:MAG TPA: ABC transporter ATP-binding protein, partial [Spirochaetia bacterium]|nr:ABC transporter ATP-binding protein [Spirochaetia bacterium]
MPLIEVRGLWHTFPRSSGGNEPFSGLHDISLDLDPGEFVVLAGPSGSGKTLLIRHLNGLLAPTAGSISYAGAPLRNKLREARLDVGMVFQDPDHQIIGQTVEEDIAFGPRNTGLGIEEVNRRVRA